MPTNCGTRVLQSDADGAYGGLLNYGGLFCHSYSSGVAINQRIVLEDTHVVCTYGDRAVWLAVSGPWTGSIMTVTARRVTSHAPLGDAVVRDSRITVSAHSSDNVSPLLNANPAKLTGLWLSGAATDYVSTPSTAAHDVTGDIELIWHGATTWATGALQGLIAKYTTVGNQRSYGLLLQADGRVTITWSVDGIAQSQAHSTSSLTATVANGLPTWIKARLDVNNGLGGYTATFWRSDQPGPDVPRSWTQIGIPVTGAGATSIFAGTSVLQAGLWVSFPMAAGVMYRAIVKAGIDGTTVADWDGRTAASRYRDASTGQLWTVQGTANAWTTT